MTDTTPVPPDVTDALQAIPSDKRAVLMRLRALILEIAASVPEAGGVTETLKWGQPSYAVKSGTPLRLGLGKGGEPALLVHCQSSVVSDARAVFDGQLSFEGNRAILVPVDQPFPEAALRQVIHAALTYRLAVPSGR